MKVYERVTSRKRKEEATGLFIGRAQGSKLYSLVLDYIYIYIIYICVCVKSNKIKYTFSGCMEVQPYMHGICPFCPHRHCFALYG